VTTDVDTARAADLDEAHVAWCMHPMNGRLTFGAYAVDYLRERGLVVAIDGDGPDTLECGESPFAFAKGTQLAALLGLDSPFTAQAVAMSVEEVADLLAALADRDLHWDTGKDCARLNEGAPEPPDLHVVFDRYAAAWQRHEERATDEGGDGDGAWFGPLGIRRTWANLRRTNGPLTPDGGIAPTTVARGAS